MLPCQRRKHCIAVETKKLWKVNWGSLRSFGIKSGAQGHASQDSNLEPRPNKVGNCRIFLIQKNAFSNIFA